MRTRILIASLFLSLGLFSCKNDKKNEVVKEVEKPITFDVIIDGVLPQDDELVLFYKDNTIAYFDEKNTVWLGIKGSDLSQKMTMSVPEGIIPNNFRLDISSKANQGEIKINSITIAFENRSFVVQQKDFPKYFTANGNLKMDSNTGSLTLDKNANGYDPYLLTKEILFPELERVRGIKL